MLKQAFLLVVSIYLFSIFTTHVIASPSIQNDKKISGEESTTVVSANKPTNEEDISYKSLYDDQKDYNDKILNTIYFALGGLGTSIFAIIGLNLFNALRTNKAEIEKIKQELLKNNEEFKKVLILDIHNQLIQYSEGTTKALDEKTQSLNQRTIDEFELEKKRIMNENKYHQEYVETSISGHKAEIVNQQKYVEAEMSNLTVKIKRLRIDQLELEAELWRVRKVEDNYLRMMALKAIAEVEIGIPPDFSMKSIFESLPEQRNVLHQYAFEPLAKLQVKLNEMNNANYSLMSERLAIILKNSTTS